MKLTNGVTPFSLLAKKFLRFSSVAPLGFSIFVTITDFQEHSAQPKTSGPPPVADFVDMAEKAGLTGVTLFGGVDTKKYIIETTGTGIAIFDYDNDGWPDICVVNGTML